MANALTIEASDGFGDSTNLEIHIPAHVWAQLDGGEPWTGSEVEGEVSSDTLKLGKVTIRLGG
ncbi:hypothetical protein [Streptomyces sp. NPDC085529]|uniref:hypothetical protein n=1 Tax=Streptomyces sp. NPDC085529 TaxID=3365729 RepID=UPI0037CD385F